MKKLKENIKIARHVVGLVSKLYHLGDAVIVEFEDASNFSNPEVTASTSRDFRIVFNIDKLSNSSEHEVYVTSFHEMRHIYQYCCIDFGYKYPNLFYEPKERIEKWKYEFDHYYASDVEDDEKYLKQDCEIDAIAFAYVMCTNILEISPVVPDVIKEEVLIRGEEIYKKLEFKMY